MALADMSWAGLGLATAVLIALMLLLQERLKVEGFALAFWCKISCVAATLPFVAFYGLPQDPLFYAWLFPQAALYVIADVALFRALPEIGAGVAARLLPASVVTSFILWFFVSPADISGLLSHPLLGAATALVLCAAVFFATRLKRCSVSMDAARRLWFVFFANTLSPVLAKITTRYATTEQGAFGFTFAEALMMLAMWLVWLVVAKPVSIKVLLARDTVQKSLTIGLISACMVVITVASYYFIDNPGYVCALQLIYAVIVLGVHKLRGKKDESDVHSGLGMVACSGLLIVLKTKFG
jgi:energy-converting hydrogenase Eha subunit C